MPWKVRFRGKTYIGDEAWDLEEELSVRDELKDVEHLSGSAEILIITPAREIEDVTIRESPDPATFPFKGIRGIHPEYGEVYLFSGVPEGGEGEMIALYEKGVIYAEPFNATAPFTGDSAQREFNEHPRLL